MSDSKKTFESEDYIVEVEKKPGCTVDFRIKASPKASEKQYKKAVRLINKEVSISGFRKGKAPEHLIRENYGHHLEKEWRDALLNEAFREAMKLTELHPFRKESVRNAKVENLSKETESEVFLTFEAEPELPELDLSKVKLEESLPEPVEEKHIDQVIEDIRYQNSEWKEAEGRAVQEGDFVDVDIENLDKPGHFLCQDTRIEVKEGKLGKWLHGLLLGMKKSESREATSEQEEGEDHPDFTPTRCKITVKEIFEAQLPEVDEALAKKVGAETVQQMRDSLKEQLKNSRKEEVQKEMREKLKRAMVEQFPFDIPESLKKAEAQRQLTERTRLLRAQIDEGEIPPDKIAALQEQVEQEVSDEIRWQFIIRHVVQENRIEIPKEELVKELMLLQYENPAALQQMQDQEAVVSMVNNTVLKRKAADHLLEQIKSLTA